MRDLRGLRIGYVPISPSLDSPGDRRRFVRYARARDLKFEVADPGKTYDLVVLTQAADLSVWRRKDGPLIVYDLIDSYLAIPKDDVKGRLRGAAKFVVRQSRRLDLDHRGAVAGMCERADAVVCSTEEQRRDIGAYCGNVHIILDIQSEVGAPTKTGYAPHQPFRLVWEGLPQTLGGFEVIRPVLERVARDHPLEMVLITDPVFHRYLRRFGKVDTLQEARRIFPNVVLHPWKASAIGPILADCDLAVVPLDLADPFAAGKPENKLLLLWRLGMPVITSATPAYVRAMARAGLAMTAATAAEWEALLRRYIEDADARRQAAQAGLACANSIYSEAATLAQWDALFASLPKQPGLAA